MVEAYLAKHHNTLIVKDLVQLRNDNTRDSLEM